MIFNEEMEREMTGKLKNNTKLNLKCQLAKQCSFFQKYKIKKSIVWLGIFSTFCCSDNSTQCENKLSHQKNGTFLHPDTMPTGIQVSSAFQSLA